MNTNPIEKISRTSFDETFEILFGEEQKINSGTSKVMFNQKQALLKNRATGEIFQTNIFASDEELGESLVIENYCFTEQDKDHWTTWAAYNSAVWQYGVDEYILVGIALISFSYLLPRFIRKIV